MRFVSLSLSLIFGACLKPTLRRKSLIQRKMKVKWAFYDVASRTIGNYLCWTSTPVLFVLLVTASKCTCCKGVCYHKCLHTNERTLNECTILYGSAHKNIKLDVSKFRYYLHGETPMSDFQFVSSSIYIVWNNEYPNRILWNVLHFGIYSFVQMTA